MKNICLLCKGIKFKTFLNLDKFPIFIGATHVEKKVRCFPLRIAICEECSLVQQVNLLDESELNEVYTDDYYNCPSPVSTGMGVREIEKFCSFFERCAIMPTKVLEIACFDGYLLAKLQKLGWDVYGCDPSHMAKIAVKQVGEGRIINEFFTKETFPPVSFDVIIFRNLLEHLYDIHDFIQTVFHVLKPGGKIFIDVPNIKAILDVGGFGTFFHQHISYFSLQTISQLLAQNNFVVKKTYEGSPNLFVCAQKRLKEENTKSRKNIKKFQGAEQEKQFFLSAFQKIESRIETIFQNTNYSKIAIFGASALTTTIINFLPKNLIKKIKYIFDNDTLKHGKVLFGCKKFISPPSEITNKEFDVLIVSTYFFDEEIFKQLIKIGVDIKKIELLNKTIPQ